MSNYERQRQLNIEKNKAILKSMGLDKPFFEPKENPHKAKAAVKKRKSTANDDESLQPPAPKISRTEPTDVVDAGVRRSARHAGKTIDYAAEQKRSASIPISFKSGIRGTDNAGPLGRESGKRTHDPSVTFPTFFCRFLCHMSGKLSGPYQELRLEHGGKPDKGVALMPFTRQSRAFHALYI